VEFRIRPIAVVLAALPFAALAQETKVPTIVITAQKPEAQASGPSGDDLKAGRAATSDTASLLRDVPGVSLYGSGGVSSLPAIHGLADDRLRIKVDGMDLIASCPNHMNPALSYVDPTNVGTLKVYAGIAPVSVGGDSIGGTIIAETVEPQFAAAGQGSLLHGEAGAFYRSNGHARGGNLAATYANESLNVSYAGATAKSDNYKAGGNYQKFTMTGVAPGVAPDEVGSSAYETRNHTLGFALKGGVHLVEAKLGYQDIPYQLYPNQRMDMLDNVQKRINLRYLGRLDWGTLEARAYREQVDHYMDFGRDRLLNYGSISNANGTWQVNGMPMNTQGRTNGASVKADIALMQRDQLRIGAEAQTYRLDDWWPPAPDCGYTSGVANCSGGMAPDTFWNINGGKRDRAAAFGEWEAKLGSQWLSQVGLRAERVTTDTGRVQGYNGMYYTTSSIGTVAAFNAMDRKRSDNNWDVTLLARNTPDAKSIFEYGYARKTRSPNLYERYDWSKSAMALEMNNFVGDGNGYLGNPDLKPEVANTVAFSGDWFSEDRTSEFKVSPYYTRVSNFIDAVRLPTVVFMMTGQSDFNSTATNKFLRLQYANQSARLYGLDVSGHLPIAKSAVGELGLKGLLNYTRGKNLDTGDNLYNIMPLNAKLTLTQATEGWNNGVEVVGVRAKDNVSAVRNEIKTPGYSLVNLRGSYSWQKIRIDFGVENLFDRLYYLPLGGAYTGQGASMSFNNEVGNVASGMMGTSGTQTMWGTAVPGAGRSFYAGVNVKF
jgi:iron complex outermembrane receptor protein